MFTDIDDYSIIVERNEPLSMELLEEYRKISRSIFKKYNGKEIRTMGDGLFVEFASIVEAVECAISLQFAFEERNKNMPPEKIFYVRIGIHSGDVIAQEGDIYGTAVNTAARVEPLAHPGGVCITEQVSAQVKELVSLPLKSIGIHKLKNLKDPVELYYVVFPWTKIPDTFKVLKNKSKNLKKIFFFSAISALFIILCFGIFYSIKN